MMRVCFVCNEYPPGPHGGIGASTRTLAQALVGAGHEVRVVGVYPRNYPAPDDEEDHGVRVWRLRRGGYRWSWITDRYRLYRRIARWIKQGEIDLVDVPDYQGWAAGWPRLPVPVIARWCASASCVSAATGRAIDPYTFRLELASLRRADFHCAKSAQLAKQTQQVFHIAGEPPVILHNLIDISADVSNGLRTANQVVFAGTLNTNKGIIPLVSAWPRVLDVHPDAELHVFGKDGRAPDGRSMKAFLESLLDNRQRQSIHFHGHVDRSVLLARLAVARAAVFPSHFEGCPGAPLEAMACGCPTIISSGVPPEIFEGFDGLKIDPDHPEQIAEAILRLLGDDRLAEHCSAAGQRHVQSRFSRSAVVAKNEEFYRQCLDAFQPFRPARPKKLRSHAFLQAALSTGPTDAR